MSSDLVVPAILPRLSTLLRRRCRTITALLYDQCGTHEDHQDEVQKEEGSQVRGEAQKAATARRLLGQAQQLYGQKRRRAEAVRLYSQALPPHLAPAPLLPEGWVKGWTQLAGELTVAHVRVGSAMEESAKSATGGPESDEALGSYKSAIGHYSAAAAGMQRNTASQSGQGSAGMEQPVLEALVDLLCAEDRYVEACCGETRSTPHFVDAAGNHRL